MIYVSGKSLVTLSCLIWKGAARKSDLERFVQEAQQRFVDLPVANLLDLKVGPCGTDWPHLKWC